MFIVHKYSSIVSAYVASDKGSGREWINGGEVIFTAPTVFVALKRAVERGKAIRFQLNRNRKHLHW